MLLMSHQPCAAHAATPAATIGVRTVNDLVVRQAALGAAALYAAGFEGGQAKDAVASFCGDLKAALTHLCDTAYRWVGGFHYGYTWGGGVGGFVAPGLHGLGHSVR